MSKTVSDSTDASWANTPAIGYSREDDLAFPTSFAQDRLFFLHQLEVGLAAYNIPVAFRLRGRLDVRALEESLAEILRRHDVLRTVFLLRDGRPVQVVGSVRPGAVPEVDLRVVPEAEREAEAVRLATVEAETSFDLSRGPLLRAKRLRLSEDEHLLVVTMHHIVSDGWSMDLFLRELASLYEAFSRGKPSPLEELPIQYADYAVWQRDSLQGEALKVELSYWKQQLAGAPDFLELPTDRRRPPLQSFRGASDSIVLPPLLADGLRSLSGREGTTLFMTLLAAFYTLLFRYTGEEDILVGSPIAGRSRVETEGLIGFFVNTLVLRGDLSGNPTFRQLLARVKDVALSAYSHQDIPFERLVEELRPKRSLAHSPLFQVLFQSRTVSEKGIELAGLEVEEVRLENRVAKFDLSLGVVADARRTTCFFEYNTDLFDATTIRRCMSHFEVLLRGILEDPNRRLSDLPLLTEPERQQVLTDWNATSLDLPREACLHELFEEQAKRTPEGLALESGRERLTYEELNQRANQLARHLMRRGVGPDVLVGICLERSIEMVVGLLGILKAGGAYVPLDPNYPQERLSFMLQDAKAAVLLTRQKHQRSLPPTTTHTVCIDGDRGKIAGEDTHNPNVHMTLDNLAYVMYTSGSTGRPKGVLIPHRGVIRLLVGADYAHLDRKTVLLHLAPISFDASTFEIWGALLHGGRCVLFPDRVPTPAEVGELIQSKKVTTAWLTGSLFNTIIDTDAEALSGVRQLLIGGEALSVSHVRRAMEVLPRTEIINGYGPTETTTFACCHQIRKDQDTVRPSIPIGRPIANTQVYVLDAKGTPVPLGAYGELYIGGDGLARGYLNRPGLTAERFLPNPFSTKPGERLFQTGDVTRLLPDGNLEFFGRTDHQVKIRGFRIEPAEIEGVLCRHRSVKEAAVVAREDRPGEKRLVAYVVGSGKDSPSPGELRDFLGSHLPNYMIPSVFVALDALPTLANGKLDRRSLPAPERTSSESEKNFAAPRDPLELQLVNIWEKVLGTRPIAVTDNFFDLGGHSLLAARLFTEIQKRLRRNLPLATLFQAQTVEQLAAVLRQDGWTPPWSALVAINPGGSTPPLFCVHAVGGNVMTYRDLARCLGPDQPVYGLQARGLDGKQKPHRRMEDLAVHYIREIRSLQPDGPYYLCGSSFGGMAAYEMAQQLTAQGETVALLGLFDTNGPGYPRYLPAQNLRRRRVDRLKQRIDLHWGNFLVCNRWEKWVYVRVKSGRLLRQQASRLRRLAKRVKARVVDPIWHPLPRALRQVEAAAGKSLFDYRPRPYAGRVTLFRASSQPSGTNPDPTLGWADLVEGGLEIHEIPGHHGAIVYEPRVKLLASRLRECLERARSLAACPARPRDQALAGAAGPRNISQKTAMEAES